uniref:Uncharacterized protein n=1 Tax=Magallana gigas TaxID=29159 RepID=K1QEJ8_MAGGI
MASFSGSSKYVCERESLLSIVCITPAFNTTGEIIIDVEIKDQDQTITRTLQYSYIVLNIADSKQRVFRQDPEDWFSGYHNISWDRDAAELQNNDMVDIYLFSLIEDTDGHLSWESQLLQEGVERSAEWAEIYLEEQKYVLAIMVTSATVKNDQPNGMDNMCCYDNDDKLIDSRYGEGGTLQRYHYLGGQDVQPFIANFYYDVLPFLYCCRYSKHYLQGNLKDASVCTSFVSQHLSNSAVVEVRLDSTSIVQLLVNGDVLAFDETLSYHFKGVSVLQITPDIDDSGATKKSHLISFTTIGISFQTTASSNVLNIIPVVGNRRITEETSLFTYKDGTAYSNYQNPSFIPAFETPTDLLADVVEVCGDDQECVFDYAVSGSSELAAETKERTQSFLSFLDAFELTVNEIQEEMHN